MTARCVLVLMFASPLFAQAPPEPMPTPPAPMPTPAAPLPTPQPIPAAPMPTPAPQAAPAVPATPQYPSVVMGKDLSTWLKDLRESPDGTIREMAVKAIPAFGPTARGPALKPLIQQLKVETDPGVRINIILVLGALGPDKPDDAKLVCDALNVLLLSAQRGSPVRLHGTRALAAYGTHAHNAMNTIIAFKDDPAWETRQTVAMALGRIGKTTGKTPAAHPDALKCLLDRLDKEVSATVRLEIVQSLVILGPPAFNKDVPGDYARIIRPYLDPVVKRIPQEADDATRVWLMVVQMMYDGTAVNESNVVKIADNITKAETAGKIAALRALALLGEQAKPALPTMLTTLKWEDPAMLVESMYALAALKGLAKDALPDLERIKNGKDEYLKSIATAAHDMITGKPVKKP